MDNLKWCAKCKGCGYLKPYQESQVVECNHCKGTGKKPDKQERNQ